MKTTTKTITTLALTSLFALGTLACDKKDEKADDKKTEEKKDDKKADDKKADDKKPEEPKPEEAKPEEPKVEGPQPSNDKEFLGLVLEPQGDWKPEWDADAKVAKWTHDDHMTGIVIRVVDDKLTNMEELEAAAPMMMQVGTAISSVTKDVEKTDNGWFTVVKYNDDKSEIYLNVREINGVTVVCSASLSSSMGDPIPEEVAHEACESYTLEQ